MIVIVDYGIGNLGSIKNMLRKIGAPAKISSDPDEIQTATKLILPGVGAFDTGMRQLRESGLVDLLNRQALEARVPVLGICLGAQLMTRASDEGVEAGLGWFDADTLRMEFDTIPGKWPLPNMGWRDVQHRDSYPLMQGYESTPRFYFVHSYYMKPDNPELASVTSNYGFDFACGLSQANLHCVQFHPEKSHSFGMRFLRNFAELPA
jgi:glutamine amidotransferase